MPARGPEPVPRETGRSVADGSPLRRHRDGVASYKERVDEHVFARCGSARVATIPTTPAAEGTSPFAPPPQYFRPPRLGIIHLLAWTAATAVWLKFFVASQRRLRYDGPVRRVLTPSHHAIQFVNAAVIGAGVVGATVILLGKARGESGRLQPGHWFVLIETVTPATLRLGGLLRVGQPDP